MKTLQDLKRDAKTGQYEANMVLRCGESDIPERLRGWRRIIGSDSTTIFLRTSDGRKSGLPVPRASLVEYDGNHIRQYLAGEMELTEEERRVLEEWNRYVSQPAFVERMKTDAYTDGSSTYWTKVAFFKKEGREYLMGNEKQRGMRYDPQTGLVSDESIKGKLYMEYEVRRVQE